MGILRLKGIGFVEQIHFEGKFRLSGKNLLWHNTTIKKCAKNTIILKVWNDL